MKRTQRLRTRRYFESMLTGILVGLMATPPGLLYGQSASTALPYVIRPQINDGSTQRSTVTNVSVFLSTNVAITASNLVLRNLSMDSAIDPTNLAVAYDTLSNYATWTFPAFP